MLARTWLRRPTCRAVVSVALSLLVAAPMLRGADALAPVDLRQVRVGGEIGRRIDVTIQNNLLVLDADRDFLAPFHARTAQDGYIGLGKLIDAAVRLAAYSGDERALARKQHLVAETIALQGPDGYVGMFEPGSRIGRLWDIHEVQYIIYGLITDYRYFGNKDALEAARKAADYLLAHWKELPTDWAKQTHVATHVAVTGLERTMLTLADATGDARYREFVVRERALPSWDTPIVIGRRDGIEGHIYAYMARSLAQLELFRTQPNPVLLSQTHRALDFLTKQNGLAITGGAGQWEIWTADQDGRGALGETCATAYQLRVYDSLLRLEGNPSYGDLMERTILNALFAAQAPDGRRIRYFSPFEGPREYHPTDTYCCPCNYRRIVAELPTMVYYRSGAGLAVNLYTPSKIELTESGKTTLVVRQETDYPSSGRVLVHVDPQQPSRFPLKLRIPRWCAQPTIAVNGEAVSAPITPGTFATLEREWKAGDQVELNFPMEWRWVRGRERQAGRAALMRGPLLFCLNPNQLPALAKKDAADLTGLVIEPGSWETVADATVHPGGVACRLRASDTGWSMGDHGNLTLTLTEFPDPEGTVSYFRLPDLSIAKPDELLETK